MRCCVDCCSARRSNSTPLLSSPLCIMTGEAHVPYTLGALTSVEHRDRRGCTRETDRVDSATHSLVPTRLLACCAAHCPCSAMGGIMGYAKTRSRISLVAGVAFGALFAVSGKLINSGEAEQVGQAQRSEAKQRRVNER